jgi:hypothetical protein
VPIPRLALLAIAACGRIGFDAQAVKVAGDARADGVGVGGDGPDANLPAGPKIWLKMETDPPSGIVDSAGGHNCYCDATTGCPMRVAGLHGFGYQFSGQQVEVDDAADLDPSSGFTAAAWVRVDSYPTTSNGTVFAKTSSTGDMFVLVVQTDGTTLFDSEDGAGVTSSGTGAMLPLGTWHHVAFVFDGTHKQYYVDGASIGMSTAGLSTDSNPFYIGADYATPAFFLTGTLDDVLYYTRALSPAEVAQLATP